MKYVKTFEAYKLNEAKETPSYQNYDLVKTKNFGEVRIIKSELLGNGKWMYYVIDNRENRKELGENAFDGAKLIKSPSAEAKKQKKLEKEKMSKALAAARAEKYKNQLSKKEYDKMIKDTADSVKSDLGSGAWDVTYDLADNLLVDSKVRDYIKRKIQREDYWGKPPSPKEQVAWDIEAAL